MPRQIQFINIHPQKPFISNKKKIISWVLLVIRKEKHKAGSISIVITNDKHLLELNKKHLNHDYYTDIITFEYSENQYVSGDLLISMDTVRENAKIFNVKIKDELHRVILHGILHLLGYKDKTKKEQRLMKSKEDYYLSLRKF